MTPKISVITVVRNGMPFVEQTIVSVIGQTYTNLEYIVIDGGSNDGTTDIIRANAGAISKWISEPDEGIADAFNKGLALVTGDYILFLNSDDALSAPHVLETMAAHISRANFPGIIYGDCDVLDRNSGKVLYRATIKFSADGLRRGQMLPHPSMFASRQYFEKYGSFDTRYRIAMDYEWLLRGGLKERIVHVPMLVTNVRSGGISTQNQHQAVNEIISALKKNKCIASGREELRLRGYFVMREVAKSVLTHLGLYRIFSWIRNRG